MMAISKLLLVISSSNLDGCCIFSNLYTWQYWMLNLSFKFWIYEEVKVFDTFASDTELNPDNLDPSLGILDQLKVEMMTY